jgi:hypothetical protein
VDVVAPRYVSRIDCEPPANWQAELVRQPATAPVDRFRLHVRNKGPLTMGSVSTKVRLTPWSKTNEELATKDVTILGEVVPDIAATPHELYHGMRSLTGAEEEVVQLHSLTNHAFRVKQFSSEHPDLSVLSLSNRANPTFRLLTKFTNPGDQRAVAAFVVEDDLGEQHRVDVAVRYYGMKGS